MPHHHPHQPEPHSRQADAALLDPPAPPTPAIETDPVFLASEAALLVPGDKAKIDAALSAVPSLSAVLQASNNAGGNTVSNLAALNFAGGLIISATSGVMRFDSNAPVIIKAAHGPSIGINAAGLDVDGVPVLTAATAPPVVAGDWVGSPPATVSDWFLRIAAAISHNGATPIP